MNTTQTRMPERPRASLAPFFRPRAVAVVGASRDPAAFGHRIVSSLVRGGYSGPVLPINPHAARIAGLHSYPSVRSAPGPIDLAIVATPAAAVPDVIDGCAAAGVAAVLVVSAGFAEAGPEGERLQQVITEKARAAGMRLIGPNCLGLLATSPEGTLNATFIDAHPPRGPVAMSSDSGALALALLACASRMGLGVSACVSVGNRADVCSSDLLEYWEEDPDTSLILLYLESFDDPLRFVRAARRLTRRKPVIAVKAGRTAAGSRAAGSHTAALAASDEAIDALFLQAGILRAGSMEEMFALASALGLQTLPRGRRVGVVTNAGGLGILCADACEGGGLQVPALSPSSREALRQALPHGAAGGNPVDLLAAATPGQYREALSLLARSGEVDALVAIRARIDAAGGAEFEEAIRAAATGLPVLACMMGGPGPAAAFDGVPCYAFPETPARVLARMAEYAEWRERKEGSVPDLAVIDIDAARAVCREALAARGPGWLDAGEARRLLRAMGVAVPPGGVARSADEAVILARRGGFPAAVKLASRRVVHKTEVGGVRLGLRNEGEVRRAYEAVRACPGGEEGALVMPMVRGGAEVIVGLTTDPRLGPLLAFGLGGIHVEILRDVAMRAAPLTDLDADGMLRAIRGRPLLEGFRGHPPADMPALRELLLRVSRLAEEVPEVREMDLNPVFALRPGQGYLIADARVRVGEAAAANGPATA